MENKREPFNPNKKDYKSIKEIESMMEANGVRLSDEKVQNLIKRFQEKEDLLNYPNLDEFSEQNEKGRSR